MDNAPFQSLITEKGFMDIDKRHHLQDIYATENKKSDDYTPQVSAELIEERKRDQRRQQLVNSFLGVTILLLVVSLIVLIAREYMQRAFVAKKTAPIASDYIPRHSLPTESQWVLELPRNYGDPTWEGEGERPFNTVWLKKAAFNINMAEQAMEQAKTDKKAFQQAVRYYEQALEIMPELEGVRIPLGIAYFKLNDPTKAKKVLEIVEEESLTFDILNLLAVVSIQEKEYEQAEHYLMRSLELEPNYKEAMRNVAMLYKEQARVEDATKAYQQYLDQNANDTDLRFDFAVYMTQSGQWETAAEQLRILTRLLTNDHLVCFLLARAESKLGNTDAAMAALRRGIQLADPSYSIAFLNDYEFDQLRNSEEFQQMMKSLQENR